jgi:hypothetical protein
MKTKVLGLIACMALLGVSQASATTDITYDLTPVTIGSYSLTGGTITTDGTIGPLASTDITAWSLTLTGFSVSPITIAGGSPYVNFSSAGSPVSASANDITFDFTSSSSGQLAFYAIYSGESSGDMNYAIPFVVLYSVNDNDNCSASFGARICLFELGGANIGASMAETSSAFVIASVLAAPLPAAVPLYAAGLGALGLFGWRRKRKDVAGLAAA